MQNFEVYTHITVSISNFVSIQRATAREYWEIKHYDATCADDKW